MFFILTVFLGWFLLNLALTLVETALQLPSGFLKEPFWMYTFIGYIVMIIYGIKSPFVITRTESPFTSIKKIEIKLFFKDIYYAIWWPYYIIKGLKK
jgi:hypothetical protein